MDKRFGHSQKTEGEQAGSGPLAPDRRRLGCEDPVASMHAARRPLHSGRHDHWGLRKPRKYGQRWRKSGRESVRPRRFSFWILGDIARPAEDCVAYYDRWIARSVPCRAVRAPHQSRLRHLYLRFNARARAARLRRQRHGLPDRRERAKAQLVPDGRHAATLSSSSPLFSYCTPAARCNGASQSSPSSPSGPYGSRVPKPLSRPPRPSLAKARAPCSSALSLLTLPVPSCTKS